MDNNGQEKKQGQGEKKGDQARSEMESSDNMENEE